MHSSEWLQKSMYEDKEDTIMSYVDEVIAKVVEQNPSEPEFHQAVKRLLESLRVVIEANEENTEGCSSGKNGKSGKTVQIPCTMG